MPINERDNPALADSLQYLPTEKDKEFIFFNKNRFKFMIEKGYLSLEDEKGRRLLDQAYAGIETIDHRLITTKNKDAAVEEENGIINVVINGNDNDPGFVWRIDTSNFSITLAIENTTDKDFRIEGLHLLSIENSFAGNNLDIFSYADNGYQSWSQAHGPSKDKFIRARGVKDPILTPEDIEHETYQDVLYMINDKKESLLLGFVTAKEQSGIIHRYDNRIAAVSQLEGKLLKKGEGVTSEELQVLIDHSYFQAMNEYNRRLGKKMNALNDTSAFIEYCTWYGRCDLEDEKSIDHALDMLNVYQDIIPVTHFQIDDCYQNSIGEWLETNKEKFPNGLTALINKAKGQGLKVGLWVSPFIISEKIMSEHPDWVIKDDLGNPLVAKVINANKNFAVDTTNPEVISWLKDTFRTLEERYGIDYFKLDFLWAGMHRGCRYEDVTGVEAYRRGIKIIREAVQSINPECKFLGCGTSFAASCGLFEIMRVGSDSMLEIKGTGIKVRNLDGTPAGDLYSTISDIVHFPQNHNLWVIDADAVIVRHQDESNPLYSNRLPMEWMKLRAITATLSGGLLVLSDDLGKISGERLEILTKCLPLNNLTAAVTDFDENGNPSQLRLDSENAAFSHVYAYTNFSSEPRIIRVTDNKKKYHLFETSGQYLGVTGEESITVEVPAYSARVLLFSQVRDEPQVVGMSTQYLGGVGELLEQKWEGSELILKLKSQGEKEGDIFINVPDGYKFAGNYSNFSDNNNIMIIPIKLSGDKTTTLLLKFEKRDLVLDKASHPMVIYS